VKSGRSAIGKWCACVGLCGVMLLAGCTQFVQAGKDAETLDAGVHDAMTRGDWKSVYANADPDMKSNTSEEKFGALFTAISKKLGHPVSSKPSGWNLNKDASGPYLRSTCETQFSNNASGTETFSWRMTDGKYRLYSYNIRSDELITR
jgi:hypothetical protein